MTTARKLTWDSARKRWKKFYKGKQLYLGSGKGKTDNQSYLLALDEFERRRIEIDKETDATKPHRSHYETAIRLREEMVRWCLLEGELGEHDRLVREIDQLRRLFARVNPPALNKPDTMPIDPLYGFSAADKILWFERVEALQNYERWSGTPDHAKTISANIDEYVSRLISQANTGQLSHSHVSKAKANLEVFREIAGKVSVEQFNASHLDQFQKLLMANLENGKWSDSYCASLATYAKMFVRWLWESNIIQDLPRNIRKVGIKIETKKPKTFTIDEIKILLTGAKGRTKLFLLLMLNTGANQRDIAELKPSEVDWETGRIIRKRTKTHKRGNVPVVNYKLWKETFDLLKQFGKRNGERVLLNEDGNPLLSIGFKELDGKIDGTGKRIDNIKSAYDRLCNRLKIKPTKPLKTLRATSGSMLFNEGRFRGLEELLLDHAPMGVGQKHYDALSDSILDEAIDWLGVQFGVIPAPAKATP